jgi:hypothetical protein
VVLFAATEAKAKEKQPMRTNRKNRGASNIKTRPKSMMKGVGPQPHNLVGFGKSARTHAHIKPQFSKGTFAV